MNKNCNPKVKCRPPCENCYPHQEERCTQCRLENNKGICDRKDCSNFAPTPLDIAEKGHKMGKESFEKNIGTPPKREEKCRICKCTEEKACQPDGCYWVEKDLCSACAGTPTEPVECPNPHNEPGMPEKCSLCTHPTDRQGWEKRFDKKFHNEIYQLRQYEISDEYNSREFKEMAARDFKDFITTHISLAVQEEREKSREALGLIKARILEYACGHHKQVLKEIDRALEYKLSSNL